MEEEIITNELEVVKSEEQLKQEAFIEKKESLIQHQIKPTADDDVVEVVEQVMKEDLLAKYDQWDIDDDAEIARRQAHKAETARLRALLDKKK